MSSAYPLKIVMEIIAVYQLTPAKTRVISSTRIPPRGNVPSTTEGALEYLRSGEMCLKPLLDQEGLDRRANTVNLSATDIVQ